MDHAYSFGMFILDLQNSWTQAVLDIGGPVFFSCSMKDKVHTFKWFIARNPCKPSLKCCSMANIILIVHVTQVIIVVKIKTIHIYHAYKINIPWGLVQMFVCQQLEFLVDP